ncbi:MAG: hypothetical protein ACYC09_07520 [Bacteroidota bacterium]
MITGNERLTYGILFITGAIIEIVISATAGARESWDADLYWSAGLPLMIAANGIAGYFGEGKNILHGIVTVGGQIITMIAISGEIGSLIIPGIVLALVLGTIVSSGSFAGRALRNYFTKA